MRQRIAQAMERANCDPLTGLLNHRAFHYELSAVLASSAVSGEPLVVAILDLDNFKFFNDVYGHTVGDKVLRSFADRLRTACGPNGKLARFGGDEFAVIFFDGDFERREEPNVESVEADIQAGMMGLDYLPTGSKFPIPILFKVGASVWLPRSGRANKPSDHISVIERAGERLRRVKSGAPEGGEAQRVRAAASLLVEGFSMLDSLVVAIENKDRYTLRHSEDVLANSLTIARELSLDEQNIEDISMAALIHDVGKIGVPDSILRKPGHLSDSEFTAIRQHPVMGAAIVGAVPGLERTLHGIRHHHERWDGAGYPDSLKAEEIPIIASILAVADAYSAMTTTRPYRRRLTHDEAVAILEAGSGTQWNPICVEAFKKSWGN